MKSKLVLAITLGALALTASAQNIRMGSDRANVRQPSTLGKSMNLSARHAVSPTPRIPASAINKSAGAKTNLVGGASAVKHVVDLPVQPDHIANTAGSDRIVAPNAVR